MNLIHLFALLRQGATLRNPGTWANASAATSALAALLWAALQIAAGFGYALPLDPEQINTLAGALVAVVGVVSPLLHIAANPHAGLPPKPEREKPDRPAKPPGPAGG